MATNETNSSIQALEQPQATELPSPGQADLEGTVTGVAKATDASDKAEDLTSQVLSFLSTASNGTLGACIVALGATTWLILGRVGLVLIGTVGGVVLHATWEGSDDRHTGAEASVRDARRRRENGLAIIGRILDWREEANGKTKLDNSIQQSQRTLDFSEFQPETGAALTVLTDTIIRDYVKYVDVGGQFYEMSG